MNVSPHTRKLITQAKRAPQLDAERELECVEAWQQRGDRRAAQRIAEANMRHVVFLAMKFRNYGIPLEDLISDGSEGLMKALNRFDRTRGVRFSTYAAYWIRAHVVQSVMRSWSLLSGPRGALHSRTFFRLRRERAKLTSRGSGACVTPELAESFGVSEERMTEMLTQLDHRGVSLDAPNPGTNVSMLDQIPSESDQERELMTARGTHALEQAVREVRPQLDERERYILDHRVLADPDDRSSLAELGAHFGVSRERVRQLELRARAKLQGFALSKTAVAEQRDQAA